MTASDRPITYARGVNVDVDADAYHPAFPRVFGRTSPSSFDPCGGGSWSFGDDAVAFDRIEPDETLAPTSAHLNRTFFPDASPLDRQISRLVALTSQRNWGLDSRTRHTVERMVAGQALHRGARGRAEEQLQQACCALRRRLDPHRLGGDLIKCELRVEYCEGRFADSVTRGGRTSYRDDLTAHEAAGG